MSDNRSILIAKFPDNRIASMAAGMLEANGIHCFVADDMMATYYQAGYTWAPVRLYVFERDAERAYELLREHGDV